MSMKLRLVLISCLLSIIPLFLFQAYYYYSTHRMILDSENKSNILEIRSSAEDISDKIKSSLETLNLFTQLSLPKVSIEFNRPEALNEFLVSSNKKNKLFDKLIVFDSDFEYFASNIPTIDVFSLIENNQKFKHVAKLLSKKSEKDLVQTAFEDNDIISFYVTTKLYDDSGNTIGYFVGLLNKDIIRDSFEELRSRIKSTDSNNVKIFMIYSAVDKGNKCSPIYVKNYNVTSLCASIPDSRFSILIRKNIFILFFTLFFLALIYAFIYHFFIGRILSPLYKFLQNLTKITEGEYVNQAVDSKYLEINALISSSNTIVKKLKANQENEIEKVKIETVAKVATQAAHDIRSPLEMLKGIKDDISLLPEDSRRRIQLGINRIEEITFNLLKANKQHKDDTDLVEDQELLGLSLSVLMEKRIELRNRENLEITELFGHHSYSLFSKINRNVFKSILSNLINNSADAIVNKSGKIELRLFSENNLNVIKISDNGRGIDSEIAKNLFSKGFTTKENGNGLGLFNARQDIRAYGGDISFESYPDSGTVFKILLPQSFAPPIFVRSICTNTFDKIIILDDDPAFHDAWLIRLHITKIKIEHVFSVKEMLLRYDSVDSNILLLTDFELMDDEYDGIDLISKLGCWDNSILVTARSEEMDIQQRCKKHGIKLLSKLLVNYVPIIHEKPKTPQMVVIIDDDKLVRINWSMFCKKNNINLKEFSTIDEFIDASSSIPKDSKIYIDSDLGNEIKGEVESERIFNMGYKNLYLATGHQKDEINKPSWIIEVYSKGPDVLKDL